MRVGLIGFGFAGATFHAPLLASTPGVEITSIVTSDPTRQARARAQHSGSRVVGHVDHLWADADDHDLIVVATTNAAHLPLGLAAIDHGLAVAIDKPLALTSAEGRQLADAAATAGVLLTVFHNRRWDGDFLTVERLVQGGALGVVHRFESRFERWRPKATPGAWRETNTPDAGGGLLLDLGSHLVDQAVQLFGPPLLVYAEVDRRRAGVHADDEVFVALTHADGARSHLWASALAGQAGPRFRVLGSTGTFTKHGMDVQEAALRAGSTPNAPGWGEDPQASWGRLGVDGDTRAVETERGRYERFYAGVRDALRDGSPPPVTPGDAIEVLRILEAARISSETGRTVAPAR